MKPFHLLALLTAAVQAAPFDILDTNRDEKLVREEMPAGLRRIFETADANHDGFIDRAEDLAFRSKNRSRTAGALQRMPENVKATTDIPYADTDNPAQRLDLFLPENRASDKPLPVIVFIHGGAWRAGSKASGGGKLAPFTSGGHYAGVSVGYRFSQEAKWPAQIYDCKAAIRWIKGHAKEHNLNPDRIAVWGSSAGGHLVAMLGVSGDVKDLEGTLGKHTDQSSRVACVADYFGPANLLTMGNFPSKMDHNAAGSPEGALIGGAIQENKQRARDASPQSYVTQDDAPVFFAHGTSDPLVPYNQTESFASALKKAGVPVYVETIEKGGHGGFEGPELNKRLKAFFDKYLLDAETTIETGTLEVRE